MLLFDCPMCGARYDVDDDLSGKVIRCRDCGELNRVLPPRSRGEKPRATAGSAVRIPDAGAMAGQGVPRPATILFKCLSCFRDYTAPGHAAGKKVRCPACGASVTVPAPADGLDPAGPGERRAARSRLLWLLAAVPLLGGLAWLGNGALYRSVPPTPGDQPVARKPNEAALRAAKEARADADAFKAELERQRNELTKLRGEQQREAATRLTEDALVKVRSKINEVESLDKETRARLARGDRERLLLFATARLDPSDKNSPPVATYYAAREKFLAESRSRQSQLHEAARLTASDLQADQNIPAGIRASFSTKVTPELARREVILKQPFPAPDLTIYRTELARIRKEAADKSKRAAEALDDFIASLPESDGKVLSRMNMRAVFFMMCRLALLHKENKMTREAIQKELQDLPPTAVPKYDEALDKLVRYGGACRMTYDADNPSVAETYFFMQLVLKGVVTEGK
jgi:DNA-directed RNA polymerase subunit RPC12/RpoP